jgi:hypothetical protein
MPKAKRKSARTKRSERQALRNETDEHDAVNTELSNIIAGISMPHNVFSTEGAGCSHWDNSPQETASCTSSNVQIGMNKQDIDSDADILHTSVEGNCKKSMSNRRVQYLRQYQKHKYACNPLWQKKRKLYMKEQYSTWSMNVD